jgi:predicted  nucleic acid-binding Zn-ribbon protein
MKKRVTNIVILQHMHLMKSSLEQQIIALDQKVATLDRKITAVDEKVDSNATSLRTEMRRGFQEAHEHRQALQEDLEATMRMLSKHDRKLARL